MKRNILILVASASAFLLSVACNRQIDYDFSSYATLYRTSYSVDETAGEVRVPVLLNNSNGSEVQISVKLNAGKAVEGVDYELISPASGVLTFSGETDSLDVVIGITAFKGEFTGAKDFSLELSSLTANAPVGALKQADFTILDLDDPRAAFIGSWAGEITGQANGVWTTSFEIKADETDKTYTKIIIDAGLDPFFVSNGFKDATYTGIVSEDKSGFTIPYGYSVGYNDFVLTGFEGGYVGYDITFALNPDGTLSNVIAYTGFSPSAGSVYEIYLPGGVFSKQ